MVAVTKDVKTKLSVGPLTQITKTYFLAYLFSPLSGCTAVTGRGCQGEGAVTCHH